MKIDRIDEYEDKTKILIDYKTGNHTGADLKTFLNNEKDRYRKQLEQYENIFKLSEEPRKIKKALY